MKKTSKTSESKKFTGFVYVINRMTYEVDEKGERKGEPIDVKQQNPADDGPRYETLKAAIQAFLDEEKRTNEKIFYVKQQNLVHIGFLNIEDGKWVEHLAIFFKIDTEIVTKMKATNVTLAQVEEAFK